MLKFSRIWRINKEIRYYIYYKKIKASLGTEIDKHKLEIVQLNNKEKQQERK